MILTGRRVGSSSKRQMSLDFPTDFSHVCDSLCVIHPCQSVQKDWSPELAVIVKEARLAQRLLVYFLIEVCYEQEDEQAKRQKQALCQGETQSVNVREKEKVPYFHLFPTLLSLKIVVEWWGVGCVCGGE